MKRSFSIAAIFVLLFFPAIGAFSADYALLQFSLLPGIAFPFGASDAAISLGTIGNISGRVDFLQAAGVFNIARGIRGFQLGGVFNIAGDEMGGIQAAGVFNIASDRHTSLQLGGVFNIADGLWGSQLAGVFNIAGDIQGAQVAPVLNIARDVRGIQVGLVNIAGKVNGFQAGLVNISSNGIFGAATTWEPLTGYVGTTWKTGNTSVFALYSVTAPKDELFRITDNTVISAGLGTRIGDSRVLYIDLSASASQALGPDLGHFVSAMTWSDGLKPADVLAPWPTLEASLSLRLGGLRLTGGLRSDIWLASLPSPPSGRAQGFAYSDTWFGQSFATWTKWYVGIGL